MDAVELLRAAARKIDEGGWVRGVMAAAADGTIEAANDPGACSFCALGALANTLGVMNAEEILADANGCIAVATLVEVLREESEMLRDLNDPVDIIVEFNDYLADNKCDVLDHLEEAAHRLEQRAAA